MLGKEYFVSLGVSIVKLFISLALTGKSMVWEAGGRRGVRVGWGSESPGHIHIWGVSIYSRVFYSLPYLRFGLTNSSPC